MGPHLLLGNSMTSVMFRKRNPAVVGEKSIEERSLRQGEEAYLSRRVMVTRKRLKVKR